MQILRVQDPRDALEKARRSEIVKYAEANGIVEIVPQMPAQLMRRILRNKGITQIPMQARALGELPRTKLPQKITTAKVQAPTEKAPGVEVNADDDLMRQWQGDQTETVAAVDYATLSRPELRALAIARGLKIAPATKSERIVEMLNGQDASRRG